MNKTKMLLNIMGRGAASACAGCVMIVIVFLALIYVSFFLLDWLHIIGISTRPGGLAVTRP